MQFVYVVDNEIRYTTKSHQSLGVIHKSQSTNFHISGIEVDSRKKCIYWSSGEQMLTIFQVNSLFVLLDLSA